MRTEFRELGSRNFNAGPSDPSGRPFSPPGRQHSMMVMTVNSAVTVNILPGMGGQGLSPTTHLPPTPPHTCLLSTQHPSLPPARLHVAAPELGGQKRGMCLNPSPCCPSTVNTVNKVSVAVSHNGQVNSLAVSPVRCFLTFLPLPSSQGPRVSTERRALLPPQELVLLCGFNIPQNSFFS